MNTDIICILDRSGSMHPTLDDAIGGFNQFLQEQRREPGEARITTVLFNSKLQTLYTAMPLAQAPEMDRNAWRPTGQTALLDAIGYTLHEQADRIRQEGRSEKVIVCILTDGQENASRYFSNISLSALIRDKEAAGWSFIFLAANQDAFSTARAMGMSEDHVMNYETAGGGTHEAFLQMGFTTSRLRRRH